MYSKTIFFFILLCTITHATAQPKLQEPHWHFMDKGSVPEASPDMPAYAKLLYADKVNLQQLDRAVKAHYEQESWDQFAHDVEHNPYAKFLKMWLEGAEPYMNEQGIVRNLNTEELIRLQQRNISLSKASKKTENNGPTSTWSFLGPGRTIWRKEHKAAQPTAPWQVNIYSIAAAPSNPSVLYAGSETGELYKTTDKGQNWTPIFDYNWGAAILSIAIHPTQPDIVYVGTSTNIFKTVDGGTTWSISYTASGLSCNSIAINPSQADTLFAGTANGLLRSYDGGASWSTIIAQQIDDVKYKPNDGSVIYTLARTGNPDNYSFYKSTDAGMNFLRSMTGWPDVYEHSGSRISVTPADDAYIYVILLTHDGSGNNQKPYILKSTDEANNWTTAADCDDVDCPLNNGQGYYDLDIVASHADPEVLIAATTTAYRSADGGTSWLAVGGYTGPFSIHPDIQEMISIMDGSVENTWISTDGGINFSTDFYDNTSNWEARILGLDGTDFWGFAQGWNADFIVGGRYHNGNTALSESYPAQEALRMGGAESVTGWAMHGRDRHVAFDDISEATLPQAIDDPVPNNTFLFTKHPQNYYYGDAFSRVMVDLEDYMTIYIGEGNSFWRSTDGGGSWEATHTFSGKPYHFDISRADGDYIYLTTDAGLYKSTDRGETFTAINLPPGFTNWHSQNLRIAASSSNRDKLWVLNQRSGASSSTGRVFESLDGGNSWTDLTTSLLSNRKWTAIAHQVGTNGGIYIAADRGTAGSLPAKVFYRDDSMSDWADFSNGFPHSARCIKLLPFYRDGKLRWGGNRGAWEVDFYETSWTASAQPFVSGKEQVCIRDTVYFDSYSVVDNTATYSWSIPGASWTSDLNSREVSALFPSNGSYTATLSITQAGQSDSKSVSITVSNECDADRHSGNALDLSGQSSDYAATGNDLGITTNTITYSAWIKPNGIQNSYTGIVFSRASSSHGMNFRNNNELGFHWNNQQWWWSSGLFAPEGEWSHVAMVVSPTEVTLYLNGEPSVNSYDPPAATIEGVVNFGADPNWSARRFNGLMDEVLIYNRAFSQAEIRELMHLTRQPAQESDMVGYWQFNRSNGKITDRAGINHASLIGGASRTTSTAPVGPGESERLTVNSAGTYDFVTANLELVFPAGGSTFPNGELCVTRIDTTPDQIPAVFGVSASYWIVHNYGSNSTFDELTSLRFDSVEVTAAGAANPSLISLYKRASNADGNTWGSPEDEADAATEGVDDGTVTFSTGNGQTSFSQFILGQLEAFFPAELLDFKLTLDVQKQVQLHWSVATEINVRHYEIERSIDAQNFAFIGKVQANGHSSSLQQYQFTDIAPLRGISYYRLKIVDQDGKVSYSPLRSIVLQALADKVAVYPTLLSKAQALQVRSEFLEPVTFELYDAEGRLVAEHTIKDAASLSLSHLSAGVYIYRVHTKTWKRSGRLVVVEE